MLALRSPAVVGLFLLMAAMGRAGEPGENARFVFHHEHILGTSLEIQIAADSQPVAERAEARALAEIQRLNDLFSTYDSSSELSHWLAGPQTAVKLSPETLDLLTVADRWRGAARGTFEPGVAVLSDLWRNAEKRGTPPTDAELSAAVTQANQPHWKTDPAHGTARRLSGSPLTFDAIAKGVILDFVSRAAMADREVQGVVINIGGDLRVAGNLTQPVAIADPRHDAENASPVARIAVRNRAVATSGNYRRGFRIGETWYSHILDPRTGRPVQHVISATVVADTATDADVLATICSVLTPAESLELVNSLEHVECLLIARDGTQHRSAGWEKLAEADQPLRNDPSADVAACDESSPTGAAKPANELVVTFELARPKDRSQYRRPYVAVWLEDESQFPVKTALLWVQTSQPGPRWHRDLLRWYRHDQMRRLVNETRLIGTVSAATRGPGEYKAVFDGTNDEGQPLKPGKYTLFIEVAREHGTYQVIRQPLTLGDAAIPSTKMKTNVEVSAAAFEYGPRNESPANSNGQ